MLLYLTLHISDIFRFVFSLQFIFHRLTSRNDDGSGGCDRSSGCGGGGG